MPPGSASGTAGKNRVEVVADGVLRDRFADLAVVDELLGGGQFAAVDEPLDVRLVDRHPPGRLLYEPLEPVPQPPVPPPRGRRVAAWRLRELARTAARLRRCRGSSRPPPVSVSGSAASSIVVSSPSCSSEISLLSRARRNSASSCSRTVRQLRLRRCSAVCSVRPRRGRVRRPPRAACRSGPRPAVLRRSGTPRRRPARRTRPASLPVDRRDEFVQPGVGRARVTKPEHGFHGGPGHLEQFGGQGEVGERFRGGSVADPSSSPNVVASESRAATAAAPGTRHHVPVCASRAASASQRGRALLSRISVSSPVAHVEPACVACSSAATLPARRRPGAGHRRRG